MPTATVPTDDPLANIPDSETLKEQIAELTRRANILRRLQKIARLREIQILTAKSATPTNHKGGSQ